jgi:beta-phosphoglucomutase
VQVAEKAREGGFGAILFDMDGVIVDSMRHHADCWIRVFAEHGVSLSAEDIFLREGMSGIDSIVDIFRSKGGRVPAPDEMRLLQERKHELFERRPIDVFPGMEEMLVYLAGKGVVLGLVTGSLRRSVGHVLPAGLMGLFRSVITVDDIENGKPHPEPYLKGLHDVGFPPEKALVVENAPLGISSARAAGLRCFAIATTLAPVYLETADRVFPSHAEFYSYMREIF